MIDMIDGSWAVHIPILLIGAAGALWSFFWPARATLRSPHPAALNLVGGGWRPPAAPDPLVCLR